MTIVKPKRNPDDGTVQQIVKHTRGDSGYITISFLDGNKQPLEFGENDIISCQVREEVDGTVLFDGEIVVDEDGITWHIRPEDTVDAEIKDYVWDIQVQLENGDIFTFVPVSPFIVLPDVTKEDDNG